MNATNPMPKLFWVAALGLSLSGIVLPEVIGAIRADYSSIANYISELGAVGAENAKIVNLFGFLPVAIFSAIAILCLRARLSGFALAQTGLVLLFIGISVGYTGAFFFPCDYGCPIEGSSRQMMHNLLGLVEYPLGSLGLILLGVGLKGRLSIFSRLIVFAVAVMSVIGFVMMISPDQSAFKGAWQRLADYSMFFLIVYLGTQLARR